MDTLIDPSLAQGIRRAYLESLDGKMAHLRREIRHDDLRNPSLQLKTLKSFHREVEKMRGFLDKAGIKRQELKLETGKKALWASLFLGREQRPAAPLNKGMSPTGFARVWVLGLSMNPGIRWCQSMSLSISEHTIDRVIQRAKLVDLPIRRDDIDAIDIQLADPLLWAAAAYFILGEIPPDNATDLTILLPSQYGFFLSDFSIDPTSSTIRTFVDYDKTWPEQQEALALLNSVSDTAIAHYAGDVIRRGHISAEHSSFDRTILKCWREYGWRIREKIGRPCEDDRAWKSIR